MSAISSLLAIYGDGSDGDATISGHPSLTRDRYYRNLVIDEIGALRTNGFRILVRNKLTLDGLIFHNGASGAVNIAGLGAVTGTLGGGANGGDGHFDADGDDGSASANALGKTGGKGGDGTVKAGGAPGLVVVPTNADGGIFVAHDMFNALLGQTLSALQIEGGSGGGGASGDGTWSGGGGGGGGGAVVIAARFWAGSGTIEARGGSGAQGQPGPGSADTGGGGGGGGGWIVIIGEHGLDDVTLDAGGGDGGAGNNLGTNGDAGDEGASFRLRTI